MKKTKQSKSNVKNSDDEDKNPSRTYINYESIILRRVNLKLKSKMRIQKFNLADVLYTKTDCPNKDYRIDVKNQLKNEVLMDCMIYEIAKVINNDLVQLKGRMDKKNYGVHRYDACDVKYILDFLNIVKRKKTDAEEVAERDYLKSVYPIVTKDLQASSTPFLRALTNATTRSASTPSKKWTSTLWFRFSNRNSTLRIYSSYDQYIFQQYCVGYFDNDVEIIQAKVETANVLKDILKREEKEYFRDLYNYIFISVTQWGEEELEKLYSIITKFKYQFRSDNLPIYVRFSYKHRKIFKEANPHILKTIVMKPKYKGASSCSSSYSRTARACSMTTSSSPGTLTSSTT